LYLTRQPTFLGSAYHFFQAQCFSRGHRARIAGDDLHPASCAAGITSAAMEDVDACILNGKDKATPIPCFNDGVQPFKRHLVHLPVLCMKADVSTNSQLVPVGELGGVGPLQEELTYVAVAERSSHEGITNAFLVELALGIEDVLAQSTEDIVGKLVGAKQVKDWFIDPNIERDLTILDIGVANQVNAREITEHMLCFQRKAEVRLFVGRPGLPVGGNE
jgi:hypothetical protein